MEFKIDEKLQGAYLKEIRMSYRAIRILYKIGKYLLILAIFFAVVYSAYCIVSGKFINSYTGKLSYETIISSVFGRVFPAFILVLILYMVRKFLEIIKVDKRISEQIHIENDFLIYFYKENHNNLMPNKIKRVVMDLKHIKEYSFDEQSRKLFVTAPMYEEVVDADKKELSFDETKLEMQSFYMTDYFKPSFYQTIEKYLLL